MQFLERLRGDERINRKEKIFLKNLIEIVGGERRVDNQIEELKKCLLQMKVNGNREEPFMKEKNINETNYVNEMVHRVNMTNGRKEWKTKDTKNQIPRMAGLKIIGYIITIQG